MKRGLLVSCLTLAAISTVPVTVGVAADGLGSDRLARIQHIVVIYQENHSFDNLYGGWEGVNGLASAQAERTIQVNQNGDPLSCLMQNDLTLAAVTPSVCSGVTATGTTYTSHFPNAPFTVDDYITPNTKTCPYQANPGPNAGGCTKDLVHRFYQELYQLNGGRQNRYTTGSDSVGLTMGLYDTQRLPILRTFIHRVIRITRSRTISSRRPLAVRS